MPVCRHQPALDFSEDIEAPAYPHTFDEMRLGAALFDDLVGQRLVSRVLARQIGRRTFGSTQWPIAAALLNRSQT